MLAALLDQIFVGKRESITAASYDLDHEIEIITNNYLSNLEKIFDVTQNRNMLFVIANQQATPTAEYPRVEAERIRLKGITYQDEASALSSKLNSDGKLMEVEYSFLVHHGMMQALEQWAADKRIPFVDVIDALNQDRHLLLSWVHLHPEGNKIIASKLAEPILESMCP
jgi:hypothetical protein